MSDFLHGSRAVRLKSIGTGLLQRATVNLIDSPGLACPCFDISSFIRSAVHVTYSPSSWKYDLAHIPISREGVSLMFDVAARNLSSVVYYVREAAGVRVRGNWRKLRRRSLCLYPMPQLAVTPQFSWKWSCAMYRLCPCYSTSHVSMRRRSRLQDGPC